MSKSPQLGLAIATADESYPASPSAVSASIKIIKFIISVAHCRLDFTINSSVAYKFKNTSAILNVDKTEITIVDETRECLSRQMMFNLFSLVM